MPNISASVQSSLINPSNNFVVALYDASAPSVVLESQAPTKPYGVPLQITFAYNCIIGHIYNVVLWESANTTPTGTSRNRFSVSIPSDAQIVNIKMDEYLQEGVTAGLTAGQTTYNNTDWLNWQYSVERIGSGTMIPDNVAGVDANYHQINTGGFGLTSLGDNFQPSEKFVVRFIPQVTTGAAPSGVPSSIFGSGQILSGATSLTNANKNQAQLIQGSGTQVAVYLPALSTVSDYDFFYFNSAGGNHINAVLSCAGSDKVLINGGLQSVIILGQSENLALFKANGVWNVEGDCTGIKQVGEIIHCYGKNQLNTVLCDGSTLNRVDYPRLWNWVQGLEESALISDSAWGSGFINVNGVTYYTNKARFSIGDGSTTFRLPLLTDYFFRGIDGSNRAPGSFEVQNIQPHTHGPITGDTASHGASSSLLSGVWGWLVNIAGLSSQVNGSDQNSQSGPVIGIGSNQETRPSNYGVYKLIRI